MDATPPKMEARAAKAPTVSPPRQRPAPPGAKDPFRFGFRERLVITPDGREVFKQTPLTPDDLVYPQEGDHVSQSWQHFSFLHTEADAIRRHLEKHRPQKMSPRRRRSWAHAISVPALWERSRG